MAPHQPHAGDAGQLLTEQTAPAAASFSRLADRTAPQSAATGTLLFVAVFAAGAAAVSLILAHITFLQATPHVALTPRDCLPGLIVAIAATLATSVLAWREHRSFATYGFRCGHPSRNLLGGTLAGVALLSTLIVLLHQLNLLVFRGQVLFGAAAQWKLAFQWIAFYALAAYAEEFLTHGYLQYTLTRGLSRWLQSYMAAPSSVAAGFWIAAVLLSIGFALLQKLTGFESRLGLLNAGLFGLLMAFSLWRTGSLWWAIGYHTAWNWTQSFLWGVPDAGLRIRDHLFLTEATGPALKSGGNTGPESSLYTLGALAAGFGILMLLHRRRVYPELWDETTTALPRPLPDTEDDNTLALSS